MSEDWSFQIPIQIRVGGEPMSAEEAEKLLLEELKDEKQDPEGVLFHLAILYGRTNRHPLAMDCIRRVLDRTDDPEKKALCFTKMGQFMEQVGNYDSAITYYRQAYSLEPTDRELWYFVNNNLGYCLNHFGRYQEGERYCRAATKIDPQRYNAYKNLGISLEGQGQYSEAARLYVLATRVNAADSRAFKHLENLVANHPQVELEIPDIQEQIDRCREAVNMAKKLGVDSRHKPNIE
jgi:tetratricopeptide (TPR) repeat protein